MPGFKGEQIGNESLLERVKDVREIQEAKINLIKMLAECKTEAQVAEVLKIKEQFMASIRQPKALARANRDVKMKI